MTTTLKEKYEIRKLQTLREKISKINENLTQPLLHEAIKKEDLNKIANTLKQLRNLPKGITTLDNFIKNLSINLNKTIGTKASKKYVAASLVLVDVLNNGFKQLPEILGNNLNLDSFPKDKSINDLTGGEGDAHDAIVKNLTMSFTKNDPNVIMKMLGKIGFGGKSEEIISGLSIENMVKDICELKLSVVESIINVLPNVQDVGGAQAASTREKVDGGSSSPEPKDEKSKELTTQEKQKATISVVDNLNQSIIATAQRKNPNITDIDGAISALKLDRDTLQVIKNIISQKP